MLKGIHLLLTYTCLFECDHCFLHCGPASRGTFSVQQIEQLLDEAKKIKTVKTIYFEGGEPFLYYPLLLEGVRLALSKGFQAGVVTNAYWATSVDDALMWLRPLKDLGLSDLGISDDVFHYGEQQDNFAKNAVAAAEKLKMGVGVFCIEKPSIEKRDDQTAARGEPIIGGGVRFRGRAVDKLTAGLPRKNWEKLVRCPDEDLADPGRVHIDSFGNVHLCQGLCIGNCWQTPLTDIIANYDPHRHPVCGPLLKGGPSALVRQHGVGHDDRYVDECHLCYLTRRQLLDRFPGCLGPRQVYGFCDQ